MSETSIFGRPLSNGVYRSKAKKKKLPRKTTSDCGTSGKRVERVRRTWNENVNILRSNLVRNLVKPIRFVPTVFDGTVFGCCRATGRLTNVFQSSEIAGCRFGRVSLLAPFYHADVNGFRFPSFAPLCFSRALNRVTGFEIIDDNSATVAADETSVRRLCAFSRVGSPFAPCPLFIPSREDRSDELKRQQRNGYGKKRNPRL